LFKDYRINIKLLKLFPSKKGTKPFLIRSIFIPGTLFTITFQEKAFCSCTTASDFRIHGR